MAEDREPEPRACPYLHQVHSDFICLYPETLYCTGDEEGRPRFPSSTTAQEYCFHHFERCEGYRQKAGG